MREVFKNGHGPYWISALETKFEGTGKPAGRKEFDEFLGNYAVYAPPPLFTQPH
jgi:hypothetical protein